MKPRFFIPERNGDCAGWLSFWSVTQPEDRWHIVDGQYFPRGAAVLTFPIHILKETQK